MLYVVQRKYVKLIGEGGKQRQLEYARKGLSVSAVPAFIFSSGGSASRSFTPILVLPRVAYFWQNVHYWPGVYKKAFARELSKQKSVKTNILV